MYTHAWNNEISKFYKLICPAKQNWSRLEVWNSSRSRQTGTWMHEQTDNIKNILIIVKY